MYVLECEFLENKKSKHNYLHNCLVNLQVGTRYAVVRVGMIMKVVRIVKCTQLDPLNIPHLAGGEYVVQVLLVDAGVRNREKYQQLKELKFEIQKRKEAVFKAAYERDLKEDSKLQLLLSDMNDLNSSGSI